MGKTTMGRVIVSGKVDNLFDLVDVSRGARSADQVRSVEFEDALVDTGATMLGMPERLIKQLGLQQFSTRRLRTTSGIRDAKIFGTVRLTVQGRECRVDVAEVPDDCPVLIGQIPLELFDFVVDPNGRRLIGNPAHGGEQMYEEY